MSAICGAYLWKEDYSQEESDSVEDSLMLGSYSGDSGNDVHEALIVCTGRHWKMGCDIAHVQRARDDAQEVAEATEPVPWEILEDGIWELKEGIGNPSLELPPVQGDA
jgi:hypothetical protein